MQQWKGTPIYLCMDTDCGRNEVAIFDGSDLEGGGNGCTSSLDGITPDAPSELQLCCNAAALVVVSGPSQHACGYRSLTISQATKNLKIPMKSVLVRSSATDCSNTFQMVVPRPGS